jgi:hypothetical protein
VALDGTLVERVDHGSVGRPAVGDDLVSHLLHALERATTCVDARSFTRKRLRDCAPDRAAGTVNERDLSFQQHAVFLSWVQADCLAGFMRPTPGR